MYLMVPYQNQAVERFADWLTTLTVEREVAKGAGGGAGKAKIVLCGHRFAHHCDLRYLLTQTSSMGGLLAADTLINLASSRPDPQAPLWPNIIACIAFDTPVSQVLLLYSVIIIRSFHTVPRTASSRLQARRHKSNGIRPNSPESRLIPRLLLIAHNRC